ncbi:hypothetical protein VB638_14165 [Dolichospermum sp. UHCC 0684]|jgi:hypothetical protein|uniref:hypothetical protein n=1 Tax=Nostocales TaxID=1161 RepID=UPI00029B69F8|nr:MULTISPECIES: hypothetical protein [Nostocales]AFW92929.1 hypothetical protein ANA_C10118 [Anabaena sp. 90]MBO1054399.1 hypothetical protein [Dolichospermum sp. DET73]MEA5530708.1 hypothetical protein [Dolichospermum sp. UHCC 0684]
MSYVLCVVLALLILALLSLAFISSKTAEIANSGVLMFRSIEHILERWINRNK